MHVYTRVGDTAWHCAACRGMHDIRSLQNGENIKAIVFALSELIISGRLRNFRHTLLTHVPHQPYIYIVVYLSLSVCQIVDGITYGLNWWAERSKIGKSPRQQLKLDVVRPDAMDVSL